MQKSPPIQSKTTAHSGDHSVEGEWKCFFCGGKKCKYEPDQWERWSSDSEMAIKGLYSHWITEDVIAMARPSERAIKTHDIIPQFLSLGVRAVINCQKRGEHASCGDGILAHTGFSYDPEALMRAGIFFYNFSWKDMTVPSVDLMLEIVQVMSFTVQSGHKLAVHCHAGLGRTGLCIASFLLLNDPTLGPQQALALVRSRRPGSVQTKKQEQFITAFSRLLASLREVFRPPGSSGISLSHFLRAQQKLLHGEAKRRHRYSPKIVDVICERLAELGPAANAAGLLGAPVASVVARSALEREVNLGRYDGAARCSDPDLLWAMLLGFLTSLKPPLLPEAFQMGALANPNKALAELNDTALGIRVTLERVVQAVKSSTIRGPGTVHIAHAVFANKDERLHAFFDVIVDHWTFTADALTLYQINSSNKKS